MEKTIELEIRSLLPGIATDEDACIQRLEKALQNHQHMRRAHIEPGSQGLKLCLHYDPEAISVGEVQRLAERAGVEINTRYKHDVVLVEGMDCSDCVMVIEHGLERMHGVLSAQVNYAAKKLWVEYDNQVVSRQSIDRRILSLGYALPRNPRRQWLYQHREVMESLTSGLLTLAGWAGQHFMGFPAALSIALFLAAYVVGGWRLGRHALQAVRERELDTDLLMVLAALGAAALGDFTDGALLIFLFSLGHALEELALDKARAAVSALAELAPKTARVRRAAGEFEVQVTEIQLADVVIVRPGARIPVDGAVLAGSSGVDQSPVTGESVPVDKSIGDKVFAGTINGEGALEVGVTRLAADSTLARVMKLVEEAQAQKSPTQQALERFERVFVPVVLGLTVLTAVVPPLFGMPIQVAVLRALTLLVAASPCALALGAPAAALAGIARAARGGVLVKGSAHLENLGRLKVVAFDKTGTLTHGRPEVTDVVAFQPESFTTSQVLSLAAALEARSGHPLAQAVLRAAAERGTKLVEVGAVESINGRGLRSTYLLQPVLCGSQKLITSTGIRLPQEAAQKTADLEAQGKTTMLVALGTQAVGLIALADTLRPDTQSTLSDLARLGVARTAMLSGDNRRVAEAVARQVGIHEVYADLLPEDKAAAVQKLEVKYGMVGMVGDGVNDAPALAIAAVGIAMGGAATDVALEAADVALMGSNLQRLPFAIGLGRATRRVIIQNLAIASAVILLLGAAAISGRVGIGLAVFFHEGSTILVVLNALRLLGYRG